MTEIDTLMPGPELDRLVAVKVMGWIAYTYGKEGSIHVEWKELLPGGGYRMHPDWAPSTDIASAWEVWKHMTQKATLIWARFCEALGVREAREREYDGQDRFTGYTCDHTALLEALRQLSPLAICRASILAVESLEGER